MNAVQAIQLIERATVPSLLLGKDKRGRYRELAMVCHPDKFPDGPERRRAEDAFIKLKKFYDELTKSAMTSFAPVKIGKWVASAPLEAGEIADLYIAETEKIEGRSVLKIVRDEQNNDLMLRERDALKKLWCDKVSKNFQRYLPVVRDSFEASGRQAIVVSEAADAFSLESIVAQVGRLDFRHIVWIGNRLWSVLGFVHRNNVIHGAVLPEHLLCGPVSHSLMLVGWCHCADTSKGEHIPAIVDARKVYYPGEVKRKLAAVETDIYMAAVCLQLAAQEIPQRFKALFEHLLAGSPASRPSDAWKIQDRWKELAVEEFGPARYLKLEIPVN